MSRLVWWVSVIIIALLNGLRPVILADTPLIIDGYYKSTLDVENPAAIYASFFPMDMSNTRPCATTPRKPSAIDLGESLKVQWVDDANKAYVVAAADGDYSGVITDPETEGVESLVPIVAPFPCKITTNPSNSKYSTEMVVQNVFNEHISLKITGMTKWYCCVTHGPNPNGFYQHFGVTKTSYANTIQTGFILGYANSKTRFAFFRDGEAISFDEFYDTVDSEGNGTTFTKCILDATYVEEEKEEQQP